MKRLLIIVLLVTLTGCHAPSSGNYALVTGDYPQAEKTFKQILRDDPGNFIIRGKLAATYVHMGRYEEALNQCRKALQDKPGYPSATLYMGLALIGKSQWEKGFDVLKSYNYPARFRQNQYVIRKAEELSTEHGLRTEEIILRMEKAVRRGEKIWIDHKRRAGD